MTRRLHAVLLGGIVSLVAACTDLDSALFSESGRTGLQLQPSSFADLEGWSLDDHDAALAAFLRSCETIDRHDPAAPLSGMPVMGLADFWQELCRVGRHVEPGKARVFFESWFQPWQATVSRHTCSVFAGCHEPQLSGSRTPDSVHSHPLYRVPDVLASLPARTTVSDGGLHGTGPELLWVDDPAEMFLVHALGFGRVHLADGSTIRVRSIRQARRSWRDIARELVKRDEIASRSVSLGSVRDWLHANPDKAPGIVATSLGDVFFSEHEAEGPLDVRSVPLTPGRSLAVDPDVLAEGIPVWIATMLPDGQPWKRMMIAQDTGSTIARPVCGDIFFGSGTWAEQTAGRMMEEGRYWILLPHLVPTGLVARAGSHRTGTAGPV